MRSFAVWAPLTLWIWTAAAFFPLVTVERCNQIGGCLGPATGASNAASKPPTMKIKQRGFDNGLSHSIRISRYLDRLTRRHQAVGLSKRTNNYSILHSNNPTLPNSAAVDQDGTDFSYFAVVNIGSGATPMYMLLDTGASNTWVMGADCTNKACQNHDTFDSSSSTSFKSHSTAFSLFYGSGNVSGTWATDSLSFAGLQLTMDLGIANATSPDFLNFPFDGILGLASATNDYPPFMVALQNAKLLKANIFGMNLNRGADGKNDGEMNFGALDSSKYTGNIAYNSLSRSDGTWAIQCDNVAIGTQNSGIPARNASIDTGTSYMFMSNDDAKTFHSSIKGSSLSSDGVYWQIPCKGQSPVQLTFNQVTYSIPTEDWVGSPTSNSNLCISNIYPGTPVDGFLLGDTFLKNVYSVFDFDQKRIGFGSKGVGSATTSSASSPSGTVAASTSSGTTGGFNAAVTSTSSSPNSASDTESSSSSSSPSTTVKGASSHFGANIFTISLFLLVATTLGS